MAHSAAACAERATDEMLIGPDWAINMELCDIINSTPGQAKDALKIIKKQMGSKKPDVQLLALSVLDALIKNCGENVIQQIIEQEILHEMVKIVAKKPNINVREKILILIDIWQEAIGRKFPQFVQAFNALRDIGVEFPPREESSATLFIPPPAQPTVHPSNFEAVATQASLQDDVSSLSASDMQTAQGLADVLMEMLGALDPNNKKGIDQELIVDLVEQCRSYHNRVLNLVNNTSNESLLFQGLALNDNLQHVLRRHEEIEKGITDPVPAKAEASAPLFIGVNHEEDESEDNFSQLAPRSQARRSTPKAEPTYAIPHLPSPPSSRKPILTDARVVDYLSGDTYQSDRPFGKSEPSFSSSGSMLPASPPYNSHSASSPSLHDKQPLYDEPAAPVPRSSDPLPQAPWEHQAPVTAPPPLRNLTNGSIYSSNMGARNSYGGSDSSFDSLVGETQNLSLNSTPPKNAKSEDALFKELVDFAKAKASSSSPSASKNNRSY
uniref:Target of Myb protein 1 n=1 Tax=Kalanchoe fedtschenkoi TaxID=63787 RepID=A0A7N0UCK6_KALFE